MDVKKIVVLVNQNKQKPSSGKKQSRKKEKIKKNKFLNTFRAPQRIKKYRIDSS